MWYRRNADTRLREMEREWLQTNNRDLLVPINRERRRVGLPPHSDARLIIANNALLNWIPDFASELLSVIEAYDEVDLPMYLHELNEMGNAAGVPEGHGDLYILITHLINDIQQLEEERRICSRASMSINYGDNIDEEYQQLLEARGMQLFSLGEIPELEEEPREEGTIPFFSLEQRQQFARTGYRDQIEQWGWILQAVSRRALKIYRKLLAYGAFPTRQIIQNDPEIAVYWHQNELSDLDKKADKIEIAINEIIDVVQGFAPSPEAVELFSQSWYKN